MTQGIGKKYILAGMSLQARLDGMEEFSGISGSGTRLLQISRSTPYLSSALVGHKRVSTSPNSTSCSILNCTICVMWRHVLLLLPQGRPLQNVR